MALHSSSHQSVTDETRLLALVPVWDAGEETCLLDRAGQFTFGSDTDCDVRIALAGVAATHGRIDCRDGHAVVTPIEGHSVQLNGTNVLEPQQIDRGDVVAFGPANFRVETRRAGVFFRRSRKEATARVDPAAKVPTSPPPQPSNVSRPPESVPTISDSAQDRASAADALPGSFDRQGRLLDEREARLSAWQTQLEQRSIDLDARSSRLSGQQTLLLQRQSEFEQRAAEIETRQKDAFEQVSQQRQQLREDAARDRQLQDSQDRIAAAERDAERDQRLQLEARLNDTLSRLQQTEADAAAARAASELEQSRHESDLAAAHSWLSEVRATAAIERETLEERLRQLEEQRAEDERQSAEALRWNEQLQCEKQAVDSELAALREEFTTREAELKDERRELDDQARQLHEDRNGIRRLQEDFESEQRERRAEIEVEREDLAQREAALARERAELEQRSGQLSDDLTQLAVQTQQLETARAAFETCQDEEQAWIETARNELVDRETNLAHEQFELEQAHTEFEVKQREYQFELDGIREEIVEREADLLAGQAELEQQSAAVNAVQHELTVRARELECAQTEFEAREREELAEFDAVRSELAEREAEVTAARAELEQQSLILKQATAELTIKTEEFAAAQIEFEQRRDGQLAEIEAAQEFLVARETAWKEGSAELEQRSAKLTQSLNALTLRAEELESARSVFDAEKERYEADIADWQSQTAIRERKLEEREIAVAEREQQLNLREEQLSDLAAEPSREDSASHRLTQQQTALDFRAKQLTAWETEVERRYEETAARVRELKRLWSQRGPTAVGAEGGTSAAAAGVHIQAEELAESRRRIEQLQLERDDLTSALNELRTAFESVRDELLSMDREAAAAGSSDDLQAATHQLAQKETELAAAEQALADKDSEVHVLETRLEAVARELEVERARIDSRPKPEITVGSTESEENLLQQVEALRAELAEASAGRGPAESERDEQDQTYEQIIHDLTQRLKETQAMLSEREDAVSGEEQLSLIADLKQRLEEQAEEIRELRDAADGKDSEDSNAGPDDLRQQHRELDDRTNLLDKREEDIRERQRMLELSEEEIETQRRQLLEARHQLELARAEIQVAMDQTPPASVGMEGREPEEEIPDSVAGGQLPAKEHAAPKVRSELAELFGLSDTAMDSPEPAKNSNELPAVDEYSQESSAAVSMSFSQAGSVLLEASPELATESSEDEESDDDENFVAKYMEQLLARNRQNAGGSLPEELNNSPKSDAAERSDQSTKRQASQPKSFIDSYLSGEFTLPETSTIGTPVDTPSPEESVRPASSPRQKIDLNAIRSDMDSFRQLSAKSVENALVSHARRQQRGGIAARTTIVTALGLVCAFVTAAAVMEVIPLGMPVWLAVGAFAATACELGFRVWMANRKVRQAAASLLKNSPGGGAAASAAAFSATAAAVSDLSQDDVGVTTDAVRDAIPQHSDDSPAHDTNIVSSPAADDEDQYFEL